MMNYNDRLISLKIKRKDLITILMALDCVVDEVEQETPRKFSAVRNSVRTCLYDFDRKNGFGAVEEEENGESDRSAFCI